MELTHYYFSLIKSLEELYISQEYKVISKGIFATKKDKDKLKYYEDIYFEKLKYIEKEIE
ncbi:MAG: hypothetical protein RSB41_03525 [Bacilli bacterium]